MRATVCIRFCASILMIVPVGSWITLDLVFKNTNETFLEIEVANKEFKENENNCFKVEEGSHKMCKLMSVVHINRITFVKISNCSVFVDTRFDCFLQYFGSDYSLVLEFHYLCSRDTVSINFENLENFIVRKTNFSLLFHLRSPLYDLCHSHVSGEKEVVIPSVKQTPLRNELYCSKLSCAKDEVILNVSSGHKILKENLHVGGNILSCSKFFKKYDKNFQRPRRNTPNRPPILNSKHFITNVLEEQPPGLVLSINISATDPDEGDAGKLTYSLHAAKDQRSQSLFEINSFTGSVSTTQKLDRESMGIHFFRVVVQDLGKPKMSTEALLTIYVKDFNDHAPVFERDLYTKSVSENLGAGGELLTVHAIDGDSEENGEITYRILNAGEVGGMFEINPHMGLITITSRLDREKRDFYKLKIMSIDGALLESKLSSTAIVEVTVQDENDNSPQFLSSPYHFDIKEDIEYLRTPFLGNIKAIDADLDKNALLRYSITSGNSLGHFMIDPNNGSLFLVGPLDYEKIQSYRLFVKAQDQGNPPKSNTTSVTINILDSNDNEPKFDVPYYHDFISENIPVGSNILNVRAHDADSGPFGTLTYIIQSKDDLPFSINGQGSIMTMREIDREVQTVYRFEVVACDSDGDSKKCSSAVVEITVRDVNDNPPVFEHRVYNSSVSEDTPPGSIVETVRATDADEDVNSRITYGIVSGNERGSFSMLNQVGYATLIVAKMLNYKQQNKYALVVSATDNTFEGTATIYISVQDVNLNRPVFLGTPYHLRLPEDTSIGQVVFSISAFDADSGNNARISYSLSPNEAFSVSEATGEMTLVSSLDRETKAGYTLTVTAVDHGHPPKFDFADIEILIIDVNDNPPLFMENSYQASVSEDSFVGANVLTVQAIDADEGMNKRIKYILDDHVQDFKIESMLGIIRTTKELDREKVADYDLVVYAVDGGEPALTGSVLVKIEVLDVNDNAPVFDSSNLVFYVEENVPVGFRVGEIKAFDLDDGSHADMMFSILPGPDSESFTLDLFDGDTFLISKVELDFESTKKEFFIDIRARSHHLFTDATIKVVITDVNDNLPVMDDFIILFNNYKDHFNLGFVGKVPAHDPDANDNLKYKFVYGNQGLLLHLNETSGIMRLDSRLNSDVPTDGTLVISVSDGINEVRATCKLFVRLVTEEMMSHSITIQIADMDPISFLGVPYDLLISAVAATVPSAQKDVLVIDIQSDSSHREGQNLALNVSFAVQRSQNQGVSFFSQEFLKEKVHLLRPLLMKLSLMKILPFEDDLCVQEPCLNFEDCNSILKFSGAADIISSGKMFFRPLRSSTTFTCQCPPGFTGMNYQFLCDVEVNLCFSNPCLNNGTCLQTEGGYQCSCLPEFTGVHCEVDVKSKNVELNPGHVCKPPSVHASTSGEGVKCQVCDAGERCTDCRDRPGSNEFCETTTRSFIGRSHLTFPPIHKKHRFNITLRFATKSVDGMLLYNGRFDGRHDFILLQIYNKQLLFSFSLGSQVTTVTTFVKGGVSTGQWVEATILYFNRTATLVVGEGCHAAVSSKLDENCTNSATQQLEQRCEDVTEICHRLLDLTGPLLIGGIPFSALHNSSIISSPYFAGCVGNLSIDMKFIDLNSFASENFTSPGCAPKKNFCASAVCENGGVCRNAWGGYKCLCSDGFTHKNCKVQVPPVDRAMKLKGNGFISFSSEQHGLAPIRHPWFISFHLRTTQSHSLLFHLEILGSGEIHSTVLNLSVKLVEGRIECIQPDFSSYILDEVINDGNWHHIQMAWSNNQLNFDLDHGISRVSYLIDDPLQGYQIGRIVFGGSPSNVGDDVEVRDGFEGCVKSIRIGSNNAVVLADRREHNVERGCAVRDMCSTNLHNCHPNTSTCINIFNNFTCICNKGYVGPDCSRNICEAYEPCDENKTKCLLNVGTPHGYECVCVGEKCHLPPVDTRCPVSWWGSPVCGPCNCPIKKGFSPNCDKRTGRCLCKPNHYLKGSECLPCDCYDIGSLSLTCDVFTGQCPCRSNVIGRQCDVCASKMAQVTNQGCDVVYTGCPKSFHKNVWWPKTPWNTVAVTDCPVKTVGTATRYCNESHGWDEPHTENCSSLVFADLKQVLAALDSDNLEVNTYVSKDVLSRLRRATNISENRMTAQDVEVTRNLLDRILSYESKRSGLDMVHSRDRHFIKNLVDVVGSILDIRYSEEWHLVHVQQPNATSVLIRNIFKYLEALTNNMQILFTQPFDAIHKNFLLGLDWISGSYPDSHVKLPKFNNKLKQEMLRDFHTHIKFPFASSDHHDKTVKASIYFGYITFKHLGTILPLNYDERLRRQLTSHSVIRSEIFHIYMINGSDSTPLKQPSVLPVEFENVPRTKQANPRCVTFNEGIWTHKGCKLAEGNSVVCLCDGISTHAVVTEDVGADLNMEPFVLDAACYAILIISTTLLLCAFIVFFFINAVPTIANIIHLNLSANMLLSFFIFLLSIDRVRNKELCRISAIFIHLFWMNGHSWMLVMLCHLYRRMTDVRDVNHGNMQSYYIVGYVIPAVIVSLAVGLRTDAYGSDYFCWILQKNILSWAYIAPITCCFILSVLILLVALYSLVGGKSKHADGDLRYFKYGLQAGCIMLILTSLSSLFLAISLNHAHILAYKYLFIAFALLQSVFLVVAYIIFSQETQRQLHYVWYKTIGHKNDEDVQKFTKKRPKSQSFHSGSSCEGMYYNKPSEMNSSHSLKSKHKKLSSALHAPPQDQQVLHLVKDVKAKEDDEYVIELHERPTMDSEESEISALERRIEDFTSSDEDEHWSAPQHELSEGTTGTPSSKTNKPPFGRGNLKRPQQEFVDSTSSGSELIR